MTGKVSGRLLLAGAFAAAVGLGVLWGSWQARPPAVGALPRQDEAHDGAGPEILYWYDPMVADRHFDRPGKSPFMDMQLVPKYREEGAPDSGVRIDPRTAQNLGLRTAAVEQTVLTGSSRFPGSIALDPRALVILQARAPGFVQREHGRAPGELVEAGAPIVDIFVPTWAGAQAEFLALRRAGDTALAAAARSRLTALGMPEDLVRSIELRDAPVPVYTLRAPRRGVLESLDARPGMTVSPGSQLGRITPVDVLWVEAAIPAARAGDVTTGATVQVEVAGLAGELIEARVIDVRPVADPESRTVQLRASFSHALERIRPGMLATVVLPDRRTGPVLTVPAEAVIRTGRRVVVIVTEAGDRFSPVAVRTGRESGGRVEIIEGLAQGQRVVTSGQFLIDSEANLQGALDRLQGAMPEAGGP